MKKEKSEQTVFCSDFSVSILGFLTVCAVKRFNDCDTKLVHAELVSLRIQTQGDCLSVKPSTAVVMNI